MFVRAGAWHIELCVLSLDLGSHAERWILLFVNQGDIVARGSNPCEIAVFAGFNACKIKQTVS